MAFDQSEWTARLRELARTLRRAARDAVAQALSRGELDELGRVVKVGAGDVTYGLDERTELALDRWLDQVARATPISLMTEDRGWLHRGPGRGGATELPGFDHGGPRIAIDPVDGTRNLMADLRSAWVVISFAPPGRGEPRMSDLTFGLVAEIPDSRGAHAREIASTRGAASELALVDARDDRVLERRTLRSRPGVRVDNAYFPFFRYLPDQRESIARIEGAFFDRLARLEGADVRTCYDDQYISSAGQLALLALGAYSTCADLRNTVARHRGKPTITSKPYDLAGAILCARAAGCVVTAPGGGELDFPIDTSTPVDFVGYANGETHAKLAPHMAAAIGALAT